MVNVEVVIVEGSMALLKVAEMLLSSATARTGLVPVTVGGIVSASSPVVKLQTKLTASGCPAESLAPVVMVAV